MSAPPPRESGPGLRSTRSDDRQEDHLAVTGWFSAWCDRHAISVRDLAAILGVSAPLARRKRIGETPVTLVDIARFPSRWRSQLVIEFASFACSLDSAA